MLANNLQRILHGPVLKLEGVFVVDGQARSGQRFWRCVIKLLVGALESNAGVQVGIVRLAGSNLNDVQLACSWIGGH